jgi:hypothetical protein
MTPEARQQPAGGQGYQRCAKTGQKQVGGEQAKRTKKFGEGMTKPGEQAIHPLGCIFLLNDQPGW